MLDHTVEVVAVQDQELAAIGHHIFRLRKHIDAAEAHAAVVARCLVMVSRDIGDLAASADPGEPPLDHVVVALR